MTDEILKEILGELREIKNILAMNSHSQTEANRPNFEQMMTNLRDTLATMNPKSAEILDSLMKGVTKHGN